MRARIRAKRLRLGISQDELAHRVGISRVAVCEYEAGRGSLSDRTLERMLDVLGMNRLAGARRQLRRSVNDAHGALRTIVEERSAP